MKRKLNPSLVQERIPYMQDRIVLRSARSITEVPIGAIEIELIQEPESELAEFRDSFRETIKAIDDHFRVPAEPEPHIFLATNSFGFDGPFRLLIYAPEPFTK